MLPIPTSGLSLKGGPCVLARLSLLGHSSQRCREIQTASLRPALSSQGSRPNPRYFYMRFQRRFLVPFHLPDVQLDAPGTSWGWQRVRWVRTWSETEARLFICRTWRPLWLTCQDTSFHFFQCDFYSAEFGGDAPWVLVELMDVHTLIAISSPKRVISSVFSPWNPAPSESPLSHSSKKP